MLGLFALHHHSLAQVFLLQVFYQDCFVLPLLVLFAHQVELLQLLPATIELSRHHLVLHELGLPWGRSLIFGFVDALNRILQLFALHSLGLLLPVLNRRQLLAFLVVNIFTIEYALLLALFILLFPLVALHGVLLKKLEVVLLLLLIAPL